MYKRRLGRKAFTLIELMIVVAIIGLLASIAVPNFERMVRKSKSAGIKSTLGQLSHGVKGVAANVGFYPTCVISGSTPRGYFTANSPWLAGKYWSTDCTTINDGVSPETSAALQDVCSLIPDPPDWAKNVNSASSGASQRYVAFIYCGMATGGFKVMAMNMFNTGEEDINTLTGIVDPGRDGGSDPCAVDPPNSFSGTAMSMCEGAAGCCM